jgi:hypothetical protein
MGHDQGASNLMSCGSAAALMNIISKPKPLWQPNCKENFDLSLSKSLMEFVLH